MSVKIFRKSQCLLLAISGCLRTYAITFALRAKADQFGGRSGGISALPLARIWRVVQQISAFNAHVGFARVGKDIGPRRRA